MKKPSLLLVLLSMLFLVACGHYSGDATTGKYSGTFVGTDVTGLNHTANGFSLAGMNQTKGLKLVADTVNKMWSNYLIAKGLEYVSGKYYDRQNNIVSTDKTIQLEKLRNAKSVADAEAAQKVLDSTLAAEAAAGVPAAAL